MKCNSCNGALDFSVTYCPYCGVRQDVDLRQIHFRDLGSDENLRCPRCTTALGVIEFDSTPPLRVERCGTCLGMFFNPGEMEVLLENNTNPLVWVDNVQLNQIAEDFGHRHEIVYRKCPVCDERMSPHNFGGGSGVILDRCGTHGVWVEGGEIRRLLEWWRAGGKHIHQQNEAERAKRLYPIEQRLGGSPIRRSVEPQSFPNQEPRWSDTTSVIPEVIEAVCAVISAVLKR